ESVPLAGCPGRVLAEDLVAARQLPAWPLSAVDGYAVRSADGGGRLRGIGESAAGRPFEGDVGEGAAVRILTGGVLPRGADAVVVGVGLPVGPGQIPDSNRYALLAALRESGAEVAVLGIVPDRADDLRRLVVEALRAADVLVTSGGVSVGTHDLVKPLLESLGDVHIGRVKLKPGKPFTFATLAEGRLAFGLPGFPVSSLVTFEVFVRPALRKLQGYTELQRPTLPVR